VNGLGTVWVCGCVALVAQCRYNKCEDFYARIAANDVPQHDVLVTNPPYSGGNVEKLLQFCATKRPPFALLMPNWVYMKPCVLSPSASTVALCGAGC